MAQIPSLSSSMKLPSFFIFLSEPVDIRNPFLMSPLLSHPGFAFLINQAVSRAAKFLHIRPDPCTTPPVFCSVKHQIAAGFTLPSHY